MLILHTRDGRICSNAILKGGEDFSLHHDGPVYIVESDFGNTMRISLQELLGRYEIGPVRNYHEWCQDRMAAIHNSEEPT